MDIGSVVSWLQLLFWIITGLSWVGKMLKDRKLEIPAVPTSTRALGILVGVGLLVSSLSLYFNYKPRTIQVAAAAPCPTIKPPLLEAWGEATGHVCVVRINGSLLLNYRDAYKVAAICGITDPMIDKFEDERITVTPLYTITGTDLTLAAPISKIMQDTTKEALSHGVKEYDQWQELVLLPVGTDSSDIKKLSDVHRYNGKILSIDGY